MSRRSVAKWILWVGLFSAFFYSAPRTATEAANDSLNLADMIRGGGPIAAAAIAFALVRQRPRRPGLVAAGFLVFSVVAVSSTAWSIDARSTFLKSVVILGCYLSAVQLPAFYPDVRSFGRDLLGITHGLLLLAAVQFLVAPDLTYRISGAYETTQRLYMIIPQVSPNQLAFLAVAGLLGLALSAGPAWVTRWWLMQLVLAGVYIAELVATRTRTAAALGLVMLAGVAVYRIRSKISPWRLLTAGGVLLSIAALFGWWSGLAEQYFLRGQSLQQLLTLTGRTEHWSTALGAWLDHVVLGLGYYSGHRFGIEGLTETQSNIDNTWLEALVDVGLLGTVPLLVAVAAGLLLLRHAGASAEGIWLVAVVAYQALVSVISPTVQSPGIGMIYLAVPLLVLELTRASRETSQESVTKTDAETPGH